MKEEKKTNTVKIGDNEVALISSCVCDVTLQILNKKEGLEVRRYNRHISMLNQYALRFDDGKELKPVILDLCYDDFPVCVESKANSSKVLIEANEHKLDVKITKASEKKAPKTGREL